MPDPVAEDRITERERERERQRERERERERSLSFYISDLLPGPVEKEIHTQREREV